MSSLETTPFVPQVQTAIVAQDNNKLAVRHDVSVPVLDHDMVMVKVEVVAINPIDAKVLHHSAVPGAIVGHDFAGTVVSVGKSELRTGRFVQGDRVAGFVHGMNLLRPDIGAFAQYVCAYADILLKIPDRMPLEKAATLGVGVATVMLGLFHHMKLPVTLDQLLEGIELTTPRVAQADREFVLVVGGSTATGTRALQMMKIANLRPIATCSPTNFNLAIEFGAEEVFDYHSSTCATDIRKYTSGNLAYAFDCISQTDTMETCYKAIGRAGGRYQALEPFDDTVAKSRPTISPSWTLTLGIFGREVALHGEYARMADPDERHFGAKAFAVAQELLDRGFVTTHPIKIMSGGWDGIIQGVDIIQQGQISAQKLVYHIPHD